MVTLTWEALAREVGISSRTLSTWRQLDGAPSGRNVSEWLEFKAAYQSTGAGDWFEALPGECSYDEAIKRGYSEQRAKCREQVIGEELSNSKLKIDIEQKRGKLLSKEDHLESLKGIASIVASSLRECPSVLLDAVPADQRRELQTAWKVASAQIQAQIHGQMKNG